MYNVLIPIASGTEEIEAVTIIDVLARAGARVTVASVMSDLNVIASRGVKLTADVFIADCTDDVFDLIVLPGGMPGAEHLRDSDTLLNMLKEQDCQERLLGAICASPAVVLQHHGLIRDRSATCYPSFEKGFQNYSSERVVVDGNLITSQGPGTAMAFALKLVECLYGKDRAIAVSEAMLFCPGKN